MMKHASSIRSFAPVAFLLAAALFLVAGTAHAQGSSPPAYIQQYSAAMQTAKQGVSLQRSDDVAGAVEKYEAAYRNLAEAAELARKDGAVENTNKIETKAAQIAYRAGSLLHNSDQSEAAIAHFEFGQQVAPPSFTQNTSGLRAARRKLQSAPVAAASQSVSQGNYREALQQLSEIEEQTGKTYFYTAIAHNRLNNTEQAVAYAGRTLEAGGLSGRRQGQMYLIIGEGQLRMGNDEAARSALERAVDLGSSSVAQSAQYTLDQM
jgi:tetratricopeptide (TPR) repeat protein